MPRALRALRWAALPGLGLTNNWKFEGNTRSQKGLFIQSVYLQSDSILAITLKLTLIMELQWFFCRVSFQTQNPNLRAVLYLISFYKKKQPGTLWIWELPSSLLKQEMSFESSGGREASFPWAKSWGEFDHLTTCSKRYKCKVFIFNNQQTHFHPFSTSMIMGGRVRSSCIS